MGLALLVTSMEASSDLVSIHEYSGATSLQKHRYCHAPNRLADGMHLNAVPCRNL